MLTKAQSTPYSRAFYVSQAEDSYRSAKALLPLVYDIVHPQSVVDVGCGVGTWLRAWKDIGVSNAVGVDGDYVDRRALQIESEKFQPMDLTKPGKLCGAPFDLVQSLEVAEHLPPAAAENFVDFICTLAPAVLFSAAIPFQGGTSHLNEQWPEYWVGLFNKNGYSVFDVIRSKVWNLTEVQYYYAQNAFLFIRRDRVSEYPQLNGICSADRQPLARVHPRKWEERVLSTPHLETLFASVPRSGVLFVRRLIRKVRNSRMSVTATRQNANLGKTW